MTDSHRGPSDSVTAALSVDVEGAKRTILSYLRWERRRVTAYDVKTYAAQRDHSAGAAALALGELIDEGQVFSQAGEVGATAFQAPGDHALCVSEGNGGPASSSHEEGDR